MEENNVIVSNTKGAVKASVIAGDHHFVADEPESVGGQNLGPTPYDLLLSSLGTCTAMTLRLYADHKEWPLEKVIVALSHAKVYEDDCENCEQSGAKIDRIERSIELVGDLDEKQRKRLMIIADKCPVHKTLSGKIQIVSQERSIA